LYRFHLSGLEGCSLPQSRSYWTELSYQLGVFVHFFHFLSLLFWLCLWCCSTLRFRSVLCCCCLETLYLLITTFFVPHIFVIHWCDFVWNSHQIACSLNLIADIIENEKNAAEEFEYNMSQMPNLYVFNDLMTSWKQEVIDACWPLLDDTTRSVLIYTHLFD